MPVIRPITAHEASYNGATHSVSIDYLDLQKSTSAANAGTTFNIELGADTVGNETQIRFAGADLKAGFANKDDNIAGMTISLGRTGAVNAYGNGVQVAENSGAKIRLIPPQNGYSAGTANITLTVNTPGANIAHSEMARGSFIAYFEIHNVAGKDF